MTQSSAQTTTAQRINKNKKIMCCCCCCCSRFIIYLSNFVSFVGIWSILYMSSSHAVYMSCSAICTNANKINVDFFRPVLSSDLVPPKMKKKICSLFFFLCELICMRFYWKSFGRVFSGWTAKFASGAVSTSTLKSICFLFFVSFFRCDTKRICNFYRTVWCNMLAVKFFWMPDITNT